MDRDRVSDYFYNAFEAGESYASISSARKAIALEIGQTIEPGTAEAKTVDEAIELALVRNSRKVVQNSTSLASFDALVDLYNRQPTLGVRSSTSARQQAYSTVLPLAYLASELAGISKNSRVYEPTAGNGALLIGADPANTTANELNPDRAQQLRSQGFTVTEYDATEYLPEEKHDVVIANPPFGRVKGKRFSLPGNPRGTSQIDQAIAMQSLQAMKDDGRAVLIMGGKPETDPTARADAYNTLETRGFFYVLHQQYQVVDHFTVNGDLYRKQGAGWPIDVIVIDGRGKSDRPLPAVEPPRIYNSFDELRGYLNDHIHQSPEFQGLRRNDQGLEAPRWVPRNVRREISQQSGELNADNLRRAHEITTGLDDAGVGETQSEQARASIDPSLNVEATQPSPRSTQPDRRGQGGESYVGMGNGLGREPPRVQLNMDGMVSSDQSRNRISNQSQGISTHRDSIGLSQRSEYRRVSNGTENPISINQAPEDSMNEEFNIPYQPRSQGRSPGTLIPTNMAAAAQKALSTVEAEQGNIDSFVQHRLGYSSKAEMFDRLYAEQIDSLALAFSQKDKGKSFLNGDQTGNGKGRFGAANIIDAKRQGYTPVFVTQRPNLYAAMLEDLSDIGFEDLQPFMTNVDASLTLKNGSVLKTGDGPSQENEMYRISQSDNNGGYDAIFTTYTQLQTVNNKEPYRRDFMRAIAPNAVFIFDEAHEAGGGQSQSWKSGPQNRAEFVRELIDRAAGVVHMSATATKHPAVMDLYARRTDATHAVQSMGQLENTLKAGGIPLQQMMATQFVSAGNMLRRERSFEQISFDAKTVAVDHEIADGISSVLRAVAEFDLEKQKCIKELKKEVRKEAKTVSEDNSIGEAAVKSTNFTSLMHNAIEQGLLSQKAENTVQEAIAALERGEKPLITLSNTMDSFLKTYAEEQGIKPGDEINVTFGDVLNRYLERSRDIQVTDYHGISERVTLTNEQLGSQAVAAFEEAKDSIAATDFTTIPLSSIDYMRYRLEQSGYRVDEITGRTNIIEYGDEGMSLGVRSKRESSPQAKIEIVDRFNSGQLDVVILNRSGATGISLHASEKFLDQRPRHMIVAQAERDINQVMQMLGRANRFGQVVEPKFTLLMADVPAEKRLGAILAKKMASLNANTTAGRDSDLSVGNVIDIMNVAGEEVISELLDENPELEAKLSYPRKGELEKENALIERVTGRIPLLPIHEQETLYAVIEAETKALIEQKEAMGENVLQADQLDLDARTVSMMEVEPADPEIQSEFTGSVTLEIVDAKAINKPPTQLQAINMIRQNLGEQPLESLDQHDPEALGELGLIKGIQAGDELQPSAEAYKQSVLSRSKSAEATAKHISTLDEQMEIFRDTVRNYAPGEPVKIGSEDGEFLRISYGVVIDFKPKARAMGSPAAPSNWSLQVLTHQGKLLNIPFSKINNGKASGYMLEARETTEIGNKDIYQEFDRLQKAQRVQMQVFTGNLLKAYEKFPTGKFVNFTDSQGSTRQGLLMDEEFDIVAKLMELPVEFQSSEQVKVFIEDLTQLRGIVESADGVLTIQADKASRLTGESLEYYSVRVPESTKQGGKYFLNEELLDAADSEFYSVGGRMEMKVSPDDLDEVTKVIMTTLDTKLVVEDSSHKEILRNYLGETMPTLKSVEPENTIEPSTTQAVSTEIAEQKQLFGLEAIPLSPPTQRSQPQQPEAIASNSIPEGQPLEPELSDPIASRSSQNIEDKQSPVEVMPAQAIADPLIPEPPIARRILPPSQQGSEAAKNIAQLLHESGLEMEVLTEANFHIRATQESFLPLVVEQHSGQLYLTHYNRMNGDSFIDAEMVFSIGDRGNLSLAETASFNPLTGGELRNKDHSFAKLFSSNLLGQGWAEAISKTREEMKQDLLQEKPERKDDVPNLDTNIPAKQSNPDQTSAAPSPDSPEVQRSPESVPSNKPSKNVPMTPENWVKVAQAIGRNSSDIAQINQIKGRPLTEKTKGLMQQDFDKHSETLNNLRNWYRAAVTIDKPKAYREGIKAIAEDFKAGQSISSKVESLMSQDLYSGLYIKLEEGIDLPKGEQRVEEVTKRAFERGMPPSEVGKILLKGNQGLRDTHKLQPKQTEKYVNQMMGKAIQKLPTQQKSKLMHQLKSMKRNIQQQKNGGISL